jgi:hypothetical protein
MTDVMITVLFPQYLFVVLIMEGIVRSGQDG